MAIIEIVSRVTYRSLMNKSKAELAHMVLDLTDMLTKQAERKSAAELIASVPGGRYYDARLESEIEQALNAEWWRGHKAAMDRQQLAAKTNRDALAPQGQTKEGGR